MRRHSHLTLSTALLSLSVVLCSNIAHSDVANASSDIASSSDPNTERAREFMRQGIAFYDKHQWQQAYDAFSEGWKLKTHYAILANLAYAEFKLGRFAEGEEHLRLYLTLVPPELVKERQLVESRFAEVRAELVTLTVSVNVDAAEVFVNGTKVGRSPIDHELFTSPGTVTLEARLAGYEPAKVTLTTSKGDVLAEKLELTRSSQQPAPVPALDAGRLAPSLPHSEPRNPSNDGPPVDKNVVLGVGLGLTGVAAGLGTFFAIRAHNIGNDEQAQQSAVDRKYPQRCAVAPGADSAECSDLDAKGQSRAAASRAMHVAFILAAGLGAATGITYWALPNSKASRPMASVWATPASGGFLIDGAF